jgi:hypothetical protein
VIIKARAGTGGAALARYLEQGKNDHAELLELRNLEAASLSQALYFMDTLAKGSHAKNHALHVQLRAAPGERLSADHWREAADRYAEAFGMQEHQAALVLHHQPDGATHCHLVINRVHPETLKAAHLSQNYAIHKRLARQIEQDWGLQQVSSEKRDQPRDYSNASHGEQEQAKRAGEDPHALRERIRSAWERADNGESFAQALQGEGFTLAQGERRDYVAVDDHGHPYSIGKRTTGATAATVRAKLADLNPANVPTLAEVRESQQEAAQRRQQGKEQAALAFERMSQRHAAKQEAQQPYRMTEAPRPTAALWRADRGQPEPEKAQETAKTAPIPANDNPAPAFNSRAEQRAAQLRQNKGQSRTWKPPDRER